MIRVNIDLTEDEVDLVLRYGLLRGVKGALNDPGEYEAECMDALIVFDRIQHKLRTAMVK